MEIPQKTKNISYDPGIPLLGIYPKQNTKSKDKNTTFKRCMYLNVHNNVFTIAKIWKQPKCLPTHVIDIHNGILLSHKKECNFAIYHKMDSLSIMLSEISQMEKDKCYMISFKSEI